MQKLINAPEAFVDEVLEGMILAHSQELARVGSRGIVRADAPIRGKVAIATGGGSGHLPLFSGYVGRGLADGAAIGEVFASPTAEDMLSVMQAIDGGAGVLQLFGNYGGDVMNFGLAADLAQADGMEVITIRGADDVASAPRGEEGRRRGIAGIVFLYKIAGAAADAGASLAEVKSVTDRAAANLRSMGVALAPCIVPAAGRPTFELPDGAMEIGMGIHGEPGVRRESLREADEIVDELIGTILDDLPMQRGESVDVLINGLGATPIEELYVLYREAAARLGADGLLIRRGWVGEYVTSLEMAGASISLLRVDDELVRLLDAPASAPLFRRL